MRLSSVPAVVASLAVSFATVEGGCPDLIDFTQTGTHCDGPCRVQSAGFGTKETMRGSFWAFGFGDPVVGAGVDNGSYSFEDWSRLFTAGIRLGGNWNTVEADSCIDNRIAPGQTDEILVIALSDLDLFGTAGSFGALAVARGSSLSPDFDLAGDLQQQIVLRPIPVPKKTGVEWEGGGSWTVEYTTPRPEEIALGFHGDGTLEVDDVILGFRLHQYRSSSYEVPTDLDRDAWIPVTDVLPVSGSPLHVYEECDDDFSRPWVHYAYSIAFESGFETEYVSHPSARSKICDPPVSDYDLDGAWEGIYPDDCPGSTSLCPMFDPLRYFAAPEVYDGWDTAGGGVDDVGPTLGFHHLGNTTKLSWRGLAYAPFYSLAREDPGEVGSCVVLPAEIPNDRDLDEPDPGFHFRYLARAGNRSWGQDSTGAEREVPCAE